MLQPLRPGMYEINLGGALPDFAQALTYRITVE